MQVQEVLRTSEGNFLLSLPPFSSFRQNVQVVLKTTSFCRKSKRVRFLATLLFDFFSDFRFAAASLPFVYYWWKK